MGRQKYPAIEDAELLDECVRFMSNWQPERWVEKDTPGFLAARRVRLFVLRWQTQKRKERRLKKERESCTGYGWCDIHGEHGP